MEQLTMRYLVTLAGVDPLTLHWSLYNDGAAPVYVPRLLTPLGAFVALAIRDGEGALVYQSETPKLKLKLDPRRAASYLALEGGYSYGAVFILDDLALPPGDYRLEVAYSNGPFQGTANAPVGVLAHHAALPLHVA